MAFTVSAEVSIARSAADVAIFLADGSNVPRWSRSITDVTVEGTALAFTTQFLGRTRRFTYEVVELDPSERMSMRLRDGEYPLETTYTWVESASGSTTIRLATTAAPNGWYRAIAPYLAWSLRRGYRRDLSSLRQVLEAEGESSTGQAQGMIPS